MILEFPTNKEINDITIMNKIHEMYGVGVGGYNLKVSEFCIEPTKDKLRIIIYGDSSFAFKVANEIYTKHLDSENILLLEVTLPFFSEKPTKELLWESLNKKYNVSFLEQFISYSVSYSVNYKFFYYLTDEQLLEFKINHAEECI